MQNNFIGRNIPVLVGLLLPIVFIIIVLLVTYIPILSIKPAHNFLYTLGPENYRQEVYKNAFSVQNGKLVMIPTGVVDVPEYATLSERPQLYLYDVAAHTTHQVTFEEMQNMSFVSGPSSPDGYLVEYRYGGYGGGFLFGGSGDNSGYFITKGSAGKRLPGIGTSGNYYQNNEFAVIGWMP